MQTSSAWHRRRRPTGSGGPSLHLSTEEPCLDKSPGRATRSVGLGSREGRRLNRAPQSTGSPCGAGSRCAQCPGRRRDGDRYGKCVTRPSYSGASLSHVVGLLPATGCAGTRASAPGALTVSVKRFEVRAEGKSAEAKDQGPMSTGSAAGDTTDDLGRLNQCPGAQGEGSQSLHPPLLGSLLFGAPQIGLKPSTISGSDPPFPRRPPRRRAPRRQGSRPSRLAW